MKIKNKKRRRINIKWIMLIVGLILLSIPVAVYAQGAATGAAPTVGGQTSAIFGDVLRGLTGFLTQLMKVLQRILWPIFLAIGGLLNNDLLFGAGMEERLLEVWTQIRNFVNIAFVVILLGIALYNVLGFAQENYQLKTFLPKFAIALIAVNFSYIAMKIILDVTNVLTVAIFTLPASISKDLPDTQIIDSKDTARINDICKGMFGSVSDFNTKIPKLIEKKEVDPAKLYCQVSNGKYTFTEEGKKFFGKFSSRNAALVLAVQMMNIVDVDKISEAVQAGKVKLESLTFNLIFSVILYVIYGTAYVVLFVVLLVRLVVLWIFIALSPLIALAILMPKLLGDSTNDLQGQFVKNAIAPIRIGIPLTIGYMMLEAFKKVGTGKVTLDVPFKAITLETSGIADLQAMIIAFAAVAVVWIGVFQAAEQTAANYFVSQIKQKVRGTAERFGSLWKYLPVIPAGEGAKGRVSWAQTKGLLERPLQRLERQYGKGTLGDLTAGKIRGGIKSWKPKAAKEAFRKGLGQAHLERQLVPLIQKWYSDKKYGRRKFIRRTLLAGVSATDIKELLKPGAKLPSRVRRRILKNVGGRFTAPTVTRPPAAGRRRKGVKGAGVAAAGGAGIGLVQTGQNLGLLGANHPLVKLRDEYQGSKTKADRRKKIETEFREKDNQITINRIRAAQGSRGDIDNVSTAAVDLGKSKDINKPDPKVLKKLADNLKTADGALRGKRVKEKDRKKILEGVLRKSLGKNYDVIKNNPDVSKYVS